MAEPAKQMTILPPEVWRNVFSYIPHDKSRYKILSSFCLVCHTFRNLAQPELFSWITDEYDKQNCNIPSRFFTVLWRSPHLGKYVQTVDISGWSWDDTQIVLDEGICAEIHSVNEQLRVEAFPDVLRSTYPQEYTYRTGNCVSTDHLMLVSKLSPNIRTINFIKHDDGHFGIEEINPTIWPNLRDLYIKRTTTRDEEYTMHEIANLLAAPKLDNVHVRNFTFGLTRNGRKERNQLKVNVNLKELGLRDCWFVGEDFDSILSLFPSLEFFEFVNANDVGANAAEKRFDRLTPRMVIGSLYKTVAETLEYLALDMFYYPRDEMGSDWVVGSLYQFDCLKYLSIDAQSILGNLLFERRQWPQRELRTGFVHAKQPLQDFFPRSLDELVITHVTVNMEQPLHWLVNNIKDVLPELKRINISFATKWIGMNSDSEDRVQTMLKMMVRTGCTINWGLDHNPEGLEHHSMLCAMSNQWKDMLRRLLQAGIDLGIQLDCDNGWSQIRKEMLG